MAAAKIHEVNTLGTVEEVGTPIKNWPLWLQLEMFVLKPHMKSDTGNGNGETMFSRPHLLGDTSYELSSWPGIYCIKHSWVVDIYGWYPAAVTMAFQRYQNAVATAYARRQKTPKTLAEIVKLKRTKEPAFVLARVPGKRTRAAIWLYGTKASMASVTAKSYLNDSNRKWELRPANNLGYLKIINPQSSPRVVKVTALLETAIELLNEFEETV